MDGDPRGLGSAPGLCAPPSTRDGISRLKLRPKALKSAALHKPVTRRGAGEAAMGAGSGTVMLIMPVAASGCANSTGPEDNEGRVLPRVQGVAELAVFGVAAGFKISIFNAFAVIAGPGNLEQQHVSGPLTKEVGNPVTPDKRHISGLLFAAGGWREVRGSRANPNGTRSKGSDPEHRNAGGDWEC